MKKIYCKLSPPDRIRVCQLNSNAVKDMYPMLGSKPKTMFGEYTSKKNPKRLAAYVKAYNQIVLPKHLLIIGSGLKLYIGPRHTEFPVRILRKFKLHQVELDNCFVIQRLSNNITQIPLSAEEPTANDPTDSTFDDFQHTNAGDNSEENNDIDNNNMEETQDENNVIEDNANERDNSQVNDNIEDSTEENDHNDNANGVSRDSNNDIEDNANEDESNSESGDSISTEPLHSMQYRNMLQTPEKFNDDQVMTLIHASKNQFLTFVDTVKPVMKKIDNDVLSLKARAFLFRMKESFITH
jgi:hypothetical protein